MYILVIILSKINAIMYFYNIIFILIYIAIRDLSCGLFLNVIKMKLIDHEWAIKRNES